MIARLAAIAMLALSLAPPLAGCKGKANKKLDAAVRKDARAKPKPPPPDLLRIVEAAFVAGEKHDQLRKMFDGDGKTSHCFATAKRASHIWLLLPEGVRIQRVDLDFAIGTKSPDIEGAKLTLRGGSLDLLKHTIGAKQAEKGVRIALAKPIKGGDLLELVVEGLTGCVRQLAMRGEAPAAGRRKAPHTPMTLEGKLPRLSCPEGATATPPTMQGSEVRVSCIDDKKRGHGPYVAWRRSDGNLLSRGSLEHGKPHGRTRTYADGNLIAEGNYDHGRKQGIWRRSNDRLHVEERFDENGQRTTMGPPPATVHPALSVAKIARKNLLVHARLRLENASDVIYLLRDNAPEKALAGRRPRSKSGRFYIASAKRAAPLFEQLWKVVHKTDLEPSNTAPKITADPLDTSGREAVVVRLSYKALGKDAPEFIVALPCVNLMARIAQGDKVRVTGSGTTRQVEIEHKSSDDDRSVKPVSVPSRGACPLTPATPTDGASADAGAEPQDGAVQAVDAAPRRRRHRRRKRRRRSRRRRKR
ncbi:MAG: hypothetical protein KC503_15460 [Myxococcales bacterium]|nr:hypothetical protein [Myxococcales bacterium]